MKAKGWPHWPRSRFCRSFRLFARYLPSCRVQVCIFANASIPTVAAACNITIAVGERNISCLVRAFGSFIALGNPSRGGACAPTVSMMPSITIDLFGAQASPSDSRCLLGARTTCPDGSDPICPSGGFAMNGAPGTYHRRPPPGHRWPEGACFRLPWIRSGDRRALRWPEHVVLQYCLRSSCRFPVRRYSATICRYEGAAQPVV